MTEAHIDLSVKFRNVLKYMRSLAPQSQEKLLNCDQILGHVAD